ncbi:MAG: hypothetical protein J6W77_07035 [Prevotella sp.]|nr:hypothetical protein [Prevotella sp.]
MKNIVFLALSLLICHGVSAQTISHGVTAFKEYQPAIVELTNGKPLKVGAANIFLKNSKLLYKSGTKVLEAKLANVKSVSIGDKYYVKIDTILAYRVDTVGKNGLYCATTIDMENYKLDMANKRHITNFEIGDHVNMTALESTKEEANEFPLQNNYYIEYNGKFVKAHELYVLRAIPKSKRIEFWATVREVGFSWIHEDSLMKLLKVISEEGSLK